MWIRRPNLVVGNCSMDKDTKTSANAIGDLFGCEYPSADIPQEKKRKSKSSGTPAYASKPQTATRYLTINEVALRYGITRATVWRWVKNDEQFPKPIKLSPGTSRWSLIHLVAFERHATSRSAHQAKNPVRRTASRQTRKAKS